MNSLGEAWHEWKDEYQRDHGPMHIAAALLMEEAFLAGAAATIMILSAGPPETLLEVRERAQALSAEMYAWVDEEDGRDPG